MNTAHSALTIEPAPKRSSFSARLTRFAASRRHDLPGVLALAGLAILEIVSTQIFIASDAINQYGPSALTDGHYQFSIDVGIDAPRVTGAWVFLPFVIAAWLFGKRRPIRIMFAIAIGIALVNVITSIIQVLVGINSHVGNVGATTLLANAALLWVMNVVIFALWYWSTDAGGPDRRGTAAAKRPDFEFPQQRREIHGWERWLPGFHDYLHAAFVTSLSFHPAGVEVLSGRAKYVSMVQALASVTILLLLVAKAIATFSPGS